MSRGNGETLRRLIEAWNTRDLEAWLGHFHPECVVAFPAEVPEPGPFHGHAELRAWAEAFLHAWEAHRAEVVDFTDAGDRAIAMLRLTGRGRGSGIETDEVDAHLFTFRDGKILRWRNFNERAEALEAAGLSG